MTQEASSSTSSLPPSLQPRGGPSFISVPLNASPFSMVVDVPTLHSSTFLGPYPFPTSHATTSDDTGSGDTSSAYQCFVCTRSWQDPVLSPSCGHIFCNDCFPRTGLCPRPGCRVPLEFRSAIPLAEADPPMNGRFRTWMEKLMLCDMCKMNIPAAKMQLHKLNDCQETMVTCGNIQDLTDGCNAQVVRRRLKDHVEQECPQRIIPCPIGVCRSRIPISQLQVHERDGVTWHMRQLSAHAKQQDDTIVQHQRTIDHLNKTVDALRVIILDMVQWRQQAVAPTVVAMATQLGVPTSGINDQLRDVVATAVDLISSENIPSNMMIGTGTGAADGVTRSMMESKGPVIPAFGAMNASSVLSTSSSSIASYSAPSTTGRRSSITRSTQPGLVNISGAPTAASSPSSSLMFASAASISSPAVPLSSYSVASPPPANASAASSSSVLSTVPSSTNPWPNVNSQQSLHHASILTEMKTPPIAASQNLSGDLPYDIMLFGGVHALSTSDRKAINSAQRFAGGIWQAIPPMPTPRGWCSAARHENRIYITGGSIVGGNRLNVVECFDLQRHAWLGSCAPLLTARDEHVTLSHDSRIWCMGGVPTGVSQALSSMEAYHIATNSWEYKAAMSQGRGYAAGACHNGLFYVFGGKPSLGVSKALTTAECYDPSSNTWKMIAPPLTARSAHRAIVVEGKIILLGGQVSSEDGKTVTAVDTGEEYDPVSNTWCISSWKLPLPCANFAIHFNADDQSLVIAGGWPIARSSAAYRRDGQTGNWSLLPPLRFANYEAAFV